MPTPNRIDYGIDAPVAIRKMFVIGVVCLLVAAFAPRTLGIERYFALHKTCLITGCVLVIEAILMLLYSRYGKFKHRDLMLSLHAWRGDEQVMDIGCGRGLLLAGAAQHLTTGRAIGIDVWSNVDLSSNSEAATLGTLELEGVADRCTLVSVPAQDITLPSESFDVIVSNLCLHNIKSKSLRIYALNHIVRLLKPGGVALISDFRHTGEYAKYFRENGLVVSKKRGSFFTTFPPLTIVIARKPYSVATDDGVRYLRR